MKTYLKKTTDPQTPIAARFGEETDGNIEWGERQDIRILISEGQGDEWFLTPLTLDGRPLNMTFVGGDRDDCLLKEQNSDHILQILKIVAPQAVRRGVENDNLESELDNLAIGRKDLSPLGKAIYDAVVEFTDAIPDEFVDRMVEELPDFHER